MIRAMALWKSSFELPFDDDGGANRSSFAGGHGREANPPQGMTTDAVPSEPAGSWRSAFEAVLDTALTEAEGLEGLVKLGRIFGTPGEDAVGFNVQHAEDASAIRSQRSVLEQLTHGLIDDADLVRMAE